MTVKAWDAGFSADRICLCDIGLVAFLLIFYGVDTLFVVLLVILFISIQGLFQWCLYRKKRKASQHIIDLVDGLEETYYIADVLPKPKEFQNEAYYYALKKACKSMNDEIGKITEEKQDYQEYVESFAHEIKIPIGALSLTFDNTKNYTLKKETDKIFQLVEQMAVWDDYETDYTIFSVCGIDIRVLDDELAEALKKLPERKRNTLLMYYFLEMTESEIANLQKITQSGVFRNRHHALETMKKILKEEH